VKPYSYALIFCFFTTIIFSASAHADDMSDARSAATLILKKLEQRKNREVWDSDVSDFFKKSITKQAFLGNMTVIEAQLGGPSSQRELIQQNKANGVAGYKGMVYSFMYASEFPAANAYEMIVVVNEDGNYKLAGINYIPNPNASTGPNSK